MKNLVLRSLVLLTLAVVNSYCSSNAQNKNAYDFIEPNVSFTYDSNVYKINEVKKNLRLDQNSYSFTLKDKSLQKTYILIRTEFSKLEPTQARQDSILKEIDNNFIENIEADGEVKVTEKKKTNLHGFSVLGISGIEQGTKKTSSTAIAVRLFKTGFTFITLLSDDGTELKKNLEILNTLLAGFKPYTKEEIDNEEAAMRQKYKVVVDSVGFTETEKTYKQATYAAIIRLSPKTEHKIYGALLRNQLYTEETDAVKNNEVRVSVRDHEKGQFTHEGHLIVENSFGKRVWLPFTINYTNSNEQ